VRVPLRVITPTLVLALGWVGLRLLQTPVAVLTSSECQETYVVDSGWLGPAPEMTGVLVADSTYGIALQVESTGGGFPYAFPRPGTITPLFFAEGSTGRKSLLTGEVQVFARDGEVIATSGQRFTYTAPGPTGPRLSNYPGGGWPMGCGPSPAQ